MQFNQNLFFFFEIANGIETSWSTSVQIQSGTMEALRLTISRSIYMFV